LLWLIALLSVTGILAFFALSGDDVAQEQSSGSQPARTVARARTGAETTEMPDVVGVRHPDAVEQLLAAGLLPESFPVDSTEKRGMVVDERPAAGTDVALGSDVRIDVSLGLGERKQRQIPDLTGLSLDEALLACARAAFTCRPVPAGGAGRVVAGQRPVAGDPTELSQIELSTG
jgi:beta-lactam-binding protein with PASTA domain